MRPPLVRLDPGRMRLEVRRISSGNLDVPVCPRIRVLRFLILLGGPLHTALSRLPKGFIKFGSFLYSAHQCVQAECVRSGRMRLCSSRRVRLLPNACVC